MTLETDFASINQLINVEEKLKHNLSSKQIIIILNKLINNACKPLFEASSYMRGLILQAIMQTQDDHRRKISIHDKEKTTYYILNAVSMNRYDAIIDCELNRSVLSAAMDRCMDIMKDAPELEDKIYANVDRVASLNKLKKIADLMGLSVFGVTPIFRWCRFYYRAYCEFKEMILTKYVRMCYNDAKFDIQKTGLQIDIKDLFENYLLAVSKAIDKCDAGKGTLTSYIKRWMLSARSCPEFDHQYGIAYTTPAAIRKSRVKEGITLNNMSQPLKLDFKLEDETYSNKIASLFERDANILKVLRGVKDASLLFMGLGISPPLKEAELARLGAS